MRDTLSCSNFAFRVDSTVEFTKEEMCSYNNSTWWLRPWFVFSSERRVFLFGTICYCFASCRL